MNPITMNLVADDIIRFALREDMNAGDLSTESVCPERREAEVQLIAKAEGVIAGLDVFERAFTLLDPRTIFDARVADGDAVEPGQLLGIVRGDARVLLSGERVALNFLQRMSGIATYTRRMAAALEGTKTRLVDTRKTMLSLLFSAVSAYLSASLYEFSSCSAVFCIPSLKIGRASCRERV